MNKLKNIIAFVNSDYVKLALFVIAAIVFAEEFPPFR